MGQIKGYKNAILNSRFDADNSYPIADGSNLFDANYSMAGDCMGFNSCTILSNYYHNSPLFYIPGQYNTFANRTFHSINAPYDILGVGHEIQPRLLKMFGAGSKFDIQVDYDGDGLPDPEFAVPINTTNYYKSIANTTSFSPADGQSWTKYGVSQTVTIPSWATKIRYGVTYLVKSDDNFRLNNFGGLSLSFGKGGHRSYVNFSCIKNESTISATTSLFNLYNNNASTYTYFNADRGSNAMCQWLGPNTSIVKVRLRLSDNFAAGVYGSITQYLDKFRTLEDTVDIPTFNNSNGPGEEPDFGNGRPETVSLEMFFAEWCFNLNDDDVASGSIYFYEPFIYFE